MALKLTRNIKRELIAENRYMGTVIVELEIGDEISFRTKGSRSRYTISLHNVLLAASANYSLQRYKDRVKAWEARGKHGRRPSPPRFDHLPVVLRRALNTR